MVVQLVVICVGVLEKWGKIASWVEYRSVRVHLNTLVDKRLILVDLHYLGGHYVDHMVLS